MAAANPWNVGATPAYELPQFNTDYVNTQRQIDPATAKWKMLQGMFQQYGTAFNVGQKAKLANYQRVLTAAQGRYDTGMGMLEGAGKQEEADIKSRWGSEANRGMQDLITRGLTGTTIAPTMRMGYQRQQEAELGRLQQSLLEQRLGYHSQLSGDVLNYMSQLPLDYPTSAQVGAAGSELAALKMPYFLAQPMKKVIVPGYPANLFDRGRDASERTFPQQGSWTTV